MTLHAAYDEALGEIAKAHGQRDLYLSKIDKILDLARDHKEAGTDIPPAEVFAAIYISDRKLDAADIRRGQEIWAEMQDHL